ncbi:STAS domain-containing protein [Blastococcus sp. VKM Ac-2987]|uniref:STAS domain-containing protein n=1 Tax=Blastococcus sp. VKM Ac-2987 TaxID=3004141 RepID=UPI0022ABC47B|nr:STAS domain-containing protein [Blastococcus sp. VKM Ac-2987]MCZ2857734.1 STAS domain-containing protein [Blastococcus sp. VKM Ac-2987]
MPPIDVPAAGSIRTAPTDGGLLLVLAGEVDAAVVLAFEASAPPPSAGAVVAVDAAAVTFIGAAGVSLVLRQTAALRAAGRRPELHRPSRAMQRILRLTELEAEFTWR